VRRTRARSAQAGEGELAALIFVGLIIWGISSGYKHLTAPANTTETDKIYSEERLNRQPYTSSETIQACSDSGCYSLVATIHHEFERDGTEHKAVEEIHFDNGGHLTFGGAPLPGAGTDQRGRVWRFSP
jgi:hypothetical protein